MLRAQHVNSFFVFFGYLKKNNGYREKLNYWHFKIIDGLHSYYITFLERNYCTTWDKVIFDLAIIILQSFTKPHSEKFRLQFVISKTCVKTRQKTEQNSSLNQIKLRKMFTQFYIGLYLKRNGRRDILQYILCLLAVWELQSSNIVNNNMHCKYWNTLYTVHVKCHSVAFEGI